MKTKILGKTNINSSRYFFFSVCFLVACIAISVWQVGQTNQRNDIKDNGQLTTAYAVSRTEIQFKTPQGNIITKPLAAPMQGTLKTYDVFEVFYDKNDPNKAVLNQDDTPMNVTIWVVAIKMLAGSLACGYLGLKKRKKTLVKI